MPLSANCPGCAKALMIPDGPPGRRIRCPDCFQVFQIDESPDAQADSAPPTAGRDALTQKPSPRPAAKPARPLAFDSDEAAQEEARKPRRPARQARDEEDEELEEAEEVQRPRRRPPEKAKKGSGVLLPLLGIGCLGGLLLLLMGGAGVAYFVLRRPMPPVAIVEPGNQGIIAKQKDGEGKLALKDGPGPNLDRDKGKDKARPKNVVDNDKDKEKDKKLDRNDKDGNRDKGEDKDKGKTVLPPRDKDKIKPPNDKTAPKSKTVKNLPSSAGSVAIAGGGKYLLLHLPTQRKIALFDVSTNEIARYVPVPADSILFAGGLEKLVVFLPETNVLQRWDLAKGERELALTVEAGENVRTMVMGHASAGPIMLGGKFYDLKTLKPLEAQLTGNRRSDFAEATHARASAEGSTFTAWKANSSPQGVNAAVVLGNKVSLFRDHDTAGQLAPSADGQTIYTARGMYTREIKPIGKAGRQGGPFTVPAVQGHYYFIFTSRDRFGFREDQQPEASLYMQGDSRALVKVTGVTWPSLNEWGREAIGIDQRVLYFPDYKKLIVLPGTNNKLMIHNFDAEAEMRRAGIDYLFVASRAPLRGEPGMRYTYKIDVRSRKGGVKLKLDSGPEGMKLEDGVVSWAIPADFAEKSVSVIVSVTDASEQEAFHSFKIALGEEPMNDEPKQPIKGKRPKKDKGKFPDDEPIVKKSDPTELGKLVWDVPTPKAPEIHAPVLGQARSAIAMKSPVANVVAGGGGRYLFLHYPKDKRVGVFDVNKVSVVKSISVDDDNVRMAADMNRLVLALPRTGVLQAYSLATFEMERSVPAPFKGQIQDVAMGWASGGPLLVWARKDDVRRENAFALLDPATLKPLATTAAEALTEKLARTSVRSVAASGDGRVFVIRSPFALHVVQRKGDRLTLRQSTEERDGMDYALPNLDGTMVYTHNGLRDLRGETVETREAGSVTIGALQGPFYVSGKSVFLHGQSKEVLTMPLRTAGELAGVGSTNVVPNHKRFYLVPAARVLIFLVGNNSQLIVNKFDVYSATERANVPYLYVTSRPPELVKADGDFAYKVKFRSRRGGVKVALVDGPKDMKVEEDGSVSWKIPASSVGKDVPVKLSLTDAGNQEIHHAFTLYVRGEKPKAEEKKDKDAN